MLKNMRCKPCEGGVEPLALLQAQQLLIEVPHWTLNAENNPMTIARDYQFKNFIEAMTFVNKVADCAEENGHHPDITISYNRVKLVLWTHAIKGLSEKDRKSVV